VNEYGKKSQRQKRRGIKGKNEHYQKVEGNGKQKKTKKVAWWIKSEKFKVPFLEKRKKSLGKKKKQLFLCNVGHKKLHQAKYRGMKYRWHQKTIHVVRTERIEGGKRGRSYLHIESAGKKRWEETSIAKIG